jgi:hypothetical protein
MFVNDVKAPYAYKRLLIPTKCTSRSYVQAQHNILHLVVLMGKALGWGIFL